MKVAIYARVSTDDQELTHQINACRRYCQFKEWEIARLYAETVSGARAKRPEYLQLVDDLRAYAYDGVVVFRLDRLGRNARELALLIDELEGKGIKVVSVNESFDTSTAIGRAMREIVMIFAQLEREQIGEATKQRLAAIKQAGKTLGRPKASDKQIARVLELSAQGQSVRAIARYSRISYGTVYNIVKGRGPYAYLLERSDSKCEQQV